MNNHIQPPDIGEVITPELKAKIYNLFEQSDALADEQSEFIEELRHRLSIAEKVCYAAYNYVRHGNSPVAIGWEELLDALKAWTAEKQKGADNET